MSIIDDLKRRKVFRTVMSYAIVAFVIMQIVDIVFPMFEIPNWAGRFVIILLFLGLPIAIILSWMFDATKEGIVRTKSEIQTESESGLSKVIAQEERKPIQKKRTWLAIGGTTLALLLGIIVSSNYGDKAFGDENGNSLAVISFENLSDTEDKSRLGQILQELIITDLSDIPILKILSSQRLVDIQKQLGLKDKRTIDPSMALEVANKAGASAMLIGNIIDVSGKKVLTSRLLNVNDGSVIKSRKVEGADVYALVDELTELLKEDLNISNAVEQTTDKAVSQKTSSNVEAYARFLTGNDFLNNGKFEEAISELQLAVDMDPSFKRAIYKLAVAQWWSAMGSSNTDSIVFVNLDAYLALPNLDEDEIKLAEGVKNIISNEFTDALASFKDLTNRYPDNKEYWYWLGECHYHGDEKYLKSLDAFEKAVNLDPAFTLAYEHIFGIYKEQELYERGIRTAKQLMKTFPENPAGYLNLRDYYRVTGKFSDALTVIEKEKKQFPERESNLRLTSTIYYMHMGLYKKALAICDEILIDQDDSKLKQTAYGRKSFIYSILGEYVKAIENTEMLLPLLKVNNPENLPIIYMEMGDIYTNIGDYEKAIKYMDRGKELINPNLGMMYFFAPYINIYFRGLVYSRTSDTESFSSNLDSFRALLNSEKQAMIKQWMNPTYDAMLFEKLAMNGEIDEALRIFEGLSIKQYELEIFLYRAGLLYIEKGNFKRALQCADDMQLPGNSNWAYSYTFSRSHYIRGRTYEAMGNMEKAKESYRALLDLWKNASPNIPELIDTKKRLADLEKIS